jgi:hypothetical protein
MPRCAFGIWKNWYVDKLIFLLVSVNVNCSLVQAMRPCTGRTAHKGSRGIALPFHDHDTRRGWGVSVTPRPLFTPGKDPVPNVQKAGWASGPFWTGAENLAPTGIRSPDRPARSQSLYRLRYPAHNISPRLVQNLNMWSMKKSKYHLKFQVQRMENTPNLHYQDRATNDVCVNNFCLF